MEWYKQCEKIGLLPDEFKSIPEEMEEKLKTETRERK